MLTTSISHVLQQLVIVDDVCRCFSNNFMAYGTYLSFHHFKKNQTPFANVSPIEISMLPLFIVDSNNSKPIIMALFCVIAVSVLVTMCSLKYHYLSSGEGYFVFVCCTQFGGLSGTITYPYCIKILILHLLLIKILCIKNTITYESCKF